MIWFLVESHNPQLQLNSRRSRGTVLQVPLLQEPPAAGWLASPALRCRSKQANLQGQARKWAYGLGTYFRQDADALHQDFTR